MDFERCGYSQSSLSEYAQLFSVCFPEARKLSDTDYLRWLYVENPLGAVVGFNARDGERLVAHYACVPMSIMIDGRVCRALLSLNTATHPDFQGKGLFTRLADLTYEAGANAGMDLVYGVANANSTPGFVRKLGFNLVSPLESRIGIGSLGSFDWARLPQSARFCHDWTSESIAWRMNNPTATVKCHNTNRASFAFSTSAGRAGFSAWAEFPVANDVLVATSADAPFCFRVWLGLLPEGLGRFSLYPSLPDRLRPSPLNLIVRGLHDPLKLDASGVFFNFLDFDAF